MTAQALYKETLLDHYRQPKNRCDGAIDGADSIARGANPRCGDEVEIGVFLQDDGIQQVRFRGRGCAICIASASMMTETVSGSTLASAAQLCDRMRAWFGDIEPATAPALPQGLEALTAVRQHPARRRCVLLSWEALAAAIGQATDR